MMGTVNVGDVRARGEVSQAGHSVSMAHYKGVTAVCENQERRGRERGL